MHWIEAIAVWGSTIMAVGFIAVLILALYWGQT